MYYDTVTSSLVVPDPNDQREHIPLGIEIEQRSYAWSYEYAEDFVLFDFDITNIGTNNINKVWPRRPPGWRPIQGLSIVHAGCPPTKRSPE